MHYCIYRQKHYIFRKLERDFGSPGQDLKWARHGNIFHAFLKIDQVPSATLCKTKTLRCTTEDVRFSSSKFDRSPVRWSYAPGLLLTIYCLNWNWLAITNPFMALKNETLSRVEMRVWSTDDDDTVAPGMMLSKKENALGTLCSCW